jgi:hypothetical protein
MKTRTFAFGILLAAAVAGASAPAAAFTCPTPTLTGVAQPADMASLLPKGDAFDDVVKLNASVAALRAKGVEAAVIVDQLISNYCAAQAGNASLTDAQRTARVRSFAARIVRTVYALDSADAIILDVAFPPDMVNEINAKAKAAGVSPQDWVVDAVISVLQAKR